MDRDPSVRIPIDQIEDGIRNAKICFAEITSDNPNVWYELGYAFAMNKEVVMVTEERQKFPFDIQHRQVINYKTGTKSDYEKLEKDITDKLKALLKRTEKIKDIINNPVAESEGLTQYEITMMLIMLENQITEADVVPPIRLNKDMDAAGFTKAASHLSIRLLRTKGLIETVVLYDEHDGSDYNAFRLTPKGEKWLLDHNDKIQLKKQ